MDYAPMLIGKESPAFDDANYLYELKLDGERCVAYLAGETVLKNKRSLLMGTRFPELSHIHRQVKSPCVLDGELMVSVEGKPDFSEVQRRSLMSNQFKIKLAADKYPATFVAYDILELKGESLINKPLIERKALLQKTVKENDRLAISRYVEGQGKALYALAEEQGLEGIVAKRKDSIYIPGKRTSNWIKSKNLLDDDYVVCGYIPKESGVTSIVLGQYDAGGILKYKGHVTLGVSGAAFDRIRKARSRKSSPIREVPAGNENARWLTPALVCTVKFMERYESGTLRQPVLKGLRDDKAPEECVEV